MRRRVQRTHLEGFIHFIQLLTELFDDEFLWVGRSLLEKYDLGSIEELKSQKKITTNTKKKNLNKVCDKN